MRCQVQLTSQLQGLENICRDTDFQPCTRPCVCVPLISLSVCKWVKSFSAGVLSSHLQATHTHTHIYLFLFFFPNMHVCKPMQRAIKCCAQWRVGYSVGRADWRNTAVITVSQWGFIRDLCVRETVFCWPHELFPMIPIIWQYNDMASESITQQRIVQFCVSFILEIQVTN